MRIIVLFNIFIGILFSNSLFSCDYKNIEMQSFDMFLSYKNNNLKQFVDSAEIIPININQVDQHGFSLAHRAAREGKIDWLAVLNWLQADLEEPDQGARGWPPIAWAISMGQKNVVQLLLHYGVSLVMPNARLYAIAGQ
jgi:ankyrin repeat protein